MTIPQVSSSGGLPCPADQIDAFLAVPTEGVRKTLSSVSGNVVVLGAGGKMGATLSLMLRDGLEGRAKVTAVSRFSDAAARAKFEGIETVSCDLLDREAVAALPDADHVFFLAGQKFGTSSAPELTWAMNAVVPAYVAERYRASKIVAFSTGCVYRFSSASEGGSREGDATEPVGDYANSCVARERVFGYFSKKYQTPLCLYRLNYSVEPRYGVLVDLGQKLLAGEEIDVSMGYVNLIWQRDAVARAIQCLEVAASPAVAMNVTGPELLSVRQLALSLAQRLGVEAKIVGTEAPTAWLSNAGRSFQLWGYPTVAIDQMINWTAAWLKGGGATLNKPTHFEARDGKF
ncbi:MAG TPA: NAD(P)-dependent oxidoreductase [Chthoniobacteraceae bacterium]|nr:NAD(P)-dependent oxidoreductase [Chthoniobacteraceae bacterium]